MGSHLTQTCTVKSGNPAAEKKQQCFLVCRGLWRRGPFRLIEPKWNISPQSFIVISLVPSHFDELSLSTFGQLTVKRARAGWRGTLSQLDLIWLWALWKANTTLDCRVLELIMVDKTEIWQNSDLIHREIMLFNTKNGRLISWQSGRNSNTVVMKSINTNYPAIVSLVIETKL